MAICSVENCGGQTIGNGLCSRHYKRFRRYGAPDIQPARGRRPFQGPCSIAGCGKVATKAGLCVVHHRRKSKGHDPVEGRKMLSAADIGHIRENRNGLTVERLAEWFNTAPSTVVAIQNGRSWGYATD